MSPISFDSSHTAAELQPRPCARPQANHDRRLGGVGEAQRRPHAHQKAHREDGGGEYLCTHALSLEEMGADKGELSVLNLSTTLDKITTALRLDVVKKNSSGELLFQLNLGLTNLACPSIVFHLSGPGSQRQ